MLQQLLAAILNNVAFGSSPTGVTLAQARIDFCGTDINKILTDAGLLGAFNESGDSGLFTPGASGNGGYAKNLANILFWDNPTGGTTILGRTANYWANAGVVQKLDKAPADGTLDNGPFVIGNPGDQRGKSVDTVAESTTILKGGAQAYNSLDGSGTDADAGVAKNSIGSLAAQTLALEYNINYYLSPASALSTFGLSNGDLSGTGLTTASTLNDLLNAANAMLNNSTSGGVTVTQAQINQILGILTGNVNTAN
jgi:hypothetical protein